jgi:hypothetical protein
MHDHVFNAIDTLKLSNGLGFSGETRIRMRSMVFNAKVAEIDMAMTVVLSVIAATILTII